MQILVLVYLRDLDNKHPLEVSLHDTFSRDLLKRAKSNCLYDIFPLLLHGLPSGYFLRWDSKVFSSYKAL